jgi:hypothetical protein
MCGRWRVRTPRPHDLHRPSKPGAGHSSSTFPGGCLAGPIRTDDLCHRRAALCSAELRRGGTRGGTRGQIQTDDWGFARPCVVRYTTRVSWYYRATRTGLEPVTFGSTVRRSSSRAHAPGGTSSRVGRNRTDGLGAPNAARYQLALQPVCYCGSERRGRSPGSWSRARCAATYTTSERCVPGGSNSDLRGKGPPGYQLPQGRKGWRGARPARDERR